MTECYVGIKPCGCLVAAACKGINDLEDTIEEWKKLGCTINLIDIEEARKRLKVCECEKIEEIKTLSEKIDETGMIHNVDVEEKIQNAQKRLKEDLIQFRNYITILRVIDKIFKEEFGEKLI